MKIFFTAEYNEEELKPLYDMGEVVLDGWAVGLPKIPEEELAEKVKDADMIITSYDDITRKAHRGSAKSEVDCMYKSNARERRYGGRERKGYTCAFYSGKKF